MKKLLAVTVLFCSALIWAGIPPSESGLKSDNDALVIPRSLAVTDGGTVTNADLATIRNPAPFNIPNSQNGNAALTVQCPDAGAWVYTDTTSVGPGLGIMVEAGGAYSTACRKTLRLQQNDGGYYTGCVIAMSPLAGAATAQCIIHQLNGSYP